jgi:uncharacterized protein YhdP
MKKTITYAIIFLIVIVGGFVASKKYVEDKIQYMQGELLHSLNSVAVYEVSVDNIDGAWRAYNYLISIKGLVVKNKTSQNIMYKQESAEIEIDIIRSMLLQKPYLKSITINEAQLMVDINKDGVIDILSLDGKTTPGKFDYTIVLKFLSQQNKVILNNSSICLVFNNKISKFNKLSAVFEDKLNKYVLNLDANLAEQEASKISSVIEIYGKLMNFSTAQISVKLNLEKLSLHDYIPKPNNLSITELYTNSAAINLIIQNSNVSQLAISADILNLSSINFSKKINLTKFYTKINKADNSYKAESLNFIFNNTNVNSKFTMELKDSSVKNLTLNTDKLKVDIQDITSYLPDKLLAPKLLEWLKKAPKKGVITGASLQLNDTDYLAKIDFSEVELDYTNNWPKLTNLSGNLRLQNDSLEINTTTSKIFSQTINSLNATIAPLRQGDKISPLIIVGEIATNTNIGLNFLEQSPLKSNVGDKIKALNPSANLYLKLKLEIPFSDDKAVGVIGDVAVIEGAIVLPGFDIPISNIQGDLKFSNDTVFSDLLKINLFDKEQIFNFDYVASSKQKNLELLNFRIHDLLNGKVEFVDNKINSGQIILGDKTTSEWSQDNKILINGTIENLTWPQWNKFSNNKSLNFSKWTVPINIDILVNNLSFQGYVFNAIRVKTDLNMQKINLSNSKISGDILLPLMGSNEYKLNLDLIDFSVLQKNSSAGNLQDSLPMVDFNCTKCIISNTDVGKMHFNLVPREYGYDVTEVRVANNQYKFEGQAQWGREKDTTEKFSITGTITTKNFGQLLKQWGYSNSVLNGNGSIIFSVNWQGGPSAFKFINLAGNAKINMERGTIKGVDQGFGKILSLLSIESLQRRLQLDFSDLSSKGLAFDKLVADFDFYNGIANTDQILLDGPSAKIVLNGSTNMVSKIIDMNMYVMPKVSSGLPLAAAIAAGNPAVGAAVWLFDKAIGLNLDKISRYHYEISGTWDTPVLKEIVSGREK